ncbi:mitochondrial 54S ribosomal protein bL12m [Limtongia smithiae]|uniref:mitochondrial 54S ribosomal protein bL12m n=1 Tax=Limtongia smithiae TaxID=1125753 RepID=UPI0034CE8D40
MAAIVSKSSLRTAARALVSRQSFNVASVCVYRTSRQNSTVAENPKISSIVDQISGLTLLETADLVSLLKTRLNIQDIAMPAAAAPVAAAAAPAAAAPEEPEVVEKTMFNVKLESFEPTAKPKIIKEVKNLLGLNLVESKKFVESAPKVLKENIVKEDAEKLKAALEALGAKITLE